MGLQQVEARTGRPLPRAPIYILAAPDDTHPEHSSAGAGPQGQSQEGQQGSMSLSTPYERLQRIRAGLEAQGDRDKGEFGCWVRLCR